MIITEILSGVSVDNFTRLPRISCSISERYSGYRSSKSRIVSREYSSPIVAASTRVMAPKQNQLFSKEKFDAFMGDNEDDDYSVGSARGGIGGHSRLGGLGGLRLVNKDQGGLGGLGRGGNSAANSPSKDPGSLGGLGRGSNSAANSPSKDPGGLGGLGAKRGNSPNKESLPAQRGNLGGLSRSGPKTLGGLKGVAAPAAKIGGLGGLKASTAATSIASGQAVKVGSDATDGTVEALKGITSLIQSISEKTLLGFKDVSNRLNQETGGDVQAALDELIKHVDDEIAAKKDNEIYIVVPGSEPRTLTFDEATDLMKNKSVRVFGSVGGIATSFHDQSTT